MHFRTRQYRRLMKRATYDIAHRAYLAILWKAWENYCHDKKINTKTNQTH